MENIKDKTAIITGGGSGIGYSISKELLRKDAKKIVIVDLPISRSQEAVATLQEKFGKERVIYFPCDVTKTEDFKETFKKALIALDGLDILVNNAGMFNDNLVEQTFNLNVVALIRGSLMALDYMGKHKGGKGGTIINIASVAGIMPVSIVPIYSASKFAVVGFGRNLEILYERTNVRSLILCPSFTKTEINLTIKHAADFVDKKYMQHTLDTHKFQPAAHVANSAIDLIQKGDNGAIWVVENNEPAFAITIPPYIQHGAL